jgi:hypothetical protein
MRRHTMKSGPVIAALVAVSGANFAGVESLEASWPGGHGLEASEPSASVSSCGSAAYPPKTRHT